MGGVFRIEDTELFEDTKSKYEENSAVKGGVGSFANTTAYMNKSEILFNEGHSGGAIHCEKNATFITY